MFATCHSHSLTVLSAYAASGVLQALPLVLGVKESRLCLLESTDHAGGKQRHLDV